MAQTHHVWLAEIWVPGIPKAQPRARSSVRTFGGRLRVYDPGTAQAWKDSIALFARPHKPLDCPLYRPIAFQADYFFIRPRSLSRRNDPEGHLPHSTKPDLDNLTKAALDAFTRMGWWVDDRVVAEERSRKWHLPKGRERPGAIFRIGIIELPERKIET